MTKQEALTILAAQQVLIAIQKERRHSSYMGGDISVADEARVECAAETAKDAITAFFVQDHVYGGGQGALIAKWALNAMHDPDLNIDDAFPILTAVETEG